MSNEEEMLKAETLYRITSESYSFIGGVNERLDDKIRNTIAIISAIIPLTMGSAYFIIGAAFSRLDQVYPYGILLIASMLSFTLSVIIAICGYFPRNFEFLDPSMLIKKYQKADRLTILQAASATLADIVKNNNEICQYKAKMIKYSQLLLVIGIILLILLFIILILAKLSGYTGQ